MKEPLVGIEELVEQASARVAAAGLAATNGQVAAAITVRNVRYYAGQGLLAPPLAHRGRRALYGEVHLDQLVAVKRLQAEGRPLAEIERVLAGLAPDRVRAVAAGSLSGRALDAWGADRERPGAVLEVRRLDGHPDALVFDLVGGASLQVAGDARFTPQAVEEALARARRTLEARLAPAFPSSAVASPSVVARQADRYQGR